MENYNNSWSLVVDRWSRDEEKVLSTQYSVRKNLASCRYSLLIRCAMVFLSTVIISPPLFAQSPPPSSSDDELLKQLNEKSTDVDRELFGDKKQDQKPADGAGQGGGDLQERLRRELGTAAEKEDDNPVLGIARRMLGVQSRIAEADAGEQVQSDQKKILADLDKLIEQAKKSCNCSGSCSNPQQSSSRTPASAAKKPGQKPGNKPSEKPAKESSQRPPDKKTVKPDPAEMRNLIKDLWGELPPNIREQMMQNPTEQFVPQYETMIEEYYRRLAEEKRE
jgi:hypothetical protein